MNIKSRQTNKFKTLTHALEKITRHDFTCTSLAILE